MSARNNMDTQEQPQGLREKRKRESRDAMHRAALELVCTHGLSNVTVEQIAERAGVSARTLFNYWGSKEAVVLGAEPASDAALVKVLHERPANEDVAESLAVVQRAYLESVTPDRSIRTLKRKVMRREPQLAQMSVNYHNDVQRSLIETLAGRMEADFDQEVAHDLATVAIYDMFASVRAAFALSMSRDIDLFEALARINAYRADGLLAFSRV